ncbi:hypothetical protein JW968_07135 [Candidatus Woesearchaeota archaeon]|nr:hypothetical protein [Candidatus Woesearchaeota archaeon]
MKRGQVTVFIVLGIVLIMIISLIIYMSSLRNKGEMEMAVEQASITDFEQIRMSTQKCVDDVAEIGYFHLGLKGGYHHIPPLHLETIYSPVPYFYYKGAKSVHTENSLEIELEDYVDEALQYCLNDFKTYRFQGYQFDNLRYATDVKFSDETVVFKVEFPFEVKQGEKVKTFTEFQYSRPSRMMTILKASERITDSIVKYPRLIPTSTLLEVSSDLNLQIDTISYEDSVVYIIQDPETVSINEVPYVFLFAASYDIENHAPIVQVADLEAEVNESFYHKVEAYDPEDDYMIFKSSNPKVPIAKYTGIISFTPSEIGSFETNISATDEKNMTGWKVITFTVKP